MNVAPKIVLGVLAAILIPLLIFGHMGYAGIMQFSAQTEKIANNLSSDYLARAAEEAVKIKASSVASEVGIYLSYKQNKNLTVPDLIADPEFLLKAMQLWAANESSWVVAVASLNGEPRILLVAKPDISRGNWGRDLKHDLGWDSKQPELYRILKRSLDNPDSPLPVCGYYHTGEKLERIEYACFYPTGIQIYDAELNVKMHLLAGTSVDVENYIEYLRKSSASNGEVTSIGRYAENAKQQIIGSLGIAVVAGVALTGIIGYFTVKDVLRPIIEISRAADRVSSGQLEARIPHQDREDEVGRLAKSVERLRRSLNRAVESLEEALK